MRVNARDRAVLTAFGVVVICAAGYAIHAQVAPSRADAAAAAYASQRPAIDAPEAETPAAPEMHIEQSTILARHLFRPAISSGPTRDFLDGGSAAGGAGVPSVTSGPARTQEPLADVSRAGWRGGAATDEDSSDSSAPAEPITIALTGVYSAGDALYALVENAEKKATKVAVGDDAFGYTVAYLNPEGAVFQANGRAYVLKVGDGKTVAKPEAKPQTAETKSGESSDPGGSSRTQMSFGGGGGGGMGGGGFDWRSMSPEDRARMAERFGGPGGPGGPGMGMRMGGPGGGRGGRGR